MSARPTSARAGSLWTSTLRWLARAGTHAPAAPPLDRAHRVRDARAASPATSADLSAPRANMRVSLRELWHLRSELYTLIGVPG
jgi:hypothetical protein